MGYAVVMGPCLVCTRVFGFNPRRVPSLTVNGSREPVCKSCIDTENDRRRPLGVELLPAPHPDAYSPISANEL
jgi:hypothetical protein